MGLGFVEHCHLGSVVYAGISVSRGFSTAAEPSSIEKFIARTARNIVIPKKAQLEVNPFQPTPSVLNEARENFIARCSVCHGPDGAGQTDIGRNLYPKVPGLRLPRTQSLTDGQIRTIIRNGVRLTGMPGWARPHDEQSDDSWKLVLFIRDLRQLTKEEQMQQASTAKSAHYMGSQSCAKCHAQIYDHWQKTPMANVVRDPREHPEAIIPDLSTNTIAKFASEDVALVCGSTRKQRLRQQI
jgi:nitrate/TMAO reductase-like tetraheme cytochrome c subunit